MNLRAVKTKTLSAASAADLDTAFAEWRDTLPNATMVTILFCVDDGTFAMQIVYTD